MGQYSTFIEYCGLIFHCDEDEGSVFDDVYEELSEECDKSPEFALELIGRFDGANLSIHPSSWLLCFRKYTRENGGKGLTDMKGDANGIPTAAEIKRLENLCIRYGIPFTAPIRDSNTYIS